RELPPEGPRGAVIDRHHARGAREPAATLLEHRGGVAVEDVARGAAEHFAVERARANAGAVQSTAVERQPARGKHQARLAAPIARYRSPSDAVEGRAAPLGIDEPAVVRSIEANRSTRGGVGRIAWFPGEH